MEWHFIALIIILVLCALLATGIPIAFVLGMLGFAGYWFFQGFEPAMAIAGHLAYRVTADFVMGTIPLFILMGEFLVIARIGSDIFDLVNKWLGRLPGGLALAAVGSCGIFAAMSGSSLATVVTIGLVAVPEMIKRGYDKKLAVGCVTAAGALGPIIPPSIILIIYGVMTDQSIGYLFIAAIIPGIITLICLVLQVAIIVLRDPKLAPKSPKYTWKERFISFRRVWVPVILIFLVLGTIYVGVCTPSEAAAVGAFGAFCISLATRRLTWSNLWAVLLRTAQTASMIIFILVGARIFSHLLTVVDIPQQLTTTIVSLEISPWLIVAGIQIMGIVMGAFLDVASIVVVTSPIFVPPWWHLGLTLFGLVRCW